MKLSSQISLKGKKKGMKALGLPNVDRYGVDLKRVSQDKRWCDR